MALPPETVIQPGHTDPTTVGRGVREQQVHPPLARPGPRGRRAGQGARRARHADPPRRRLRRRPQGLGPLARRARRHRPRLAGSSGSRSPWPATIASRPRGGRAPRRSAASPRRRAPSRPARARSNLTRDEQAANDAMARRQVETAKQIVAALGTMKGAAMKLGQVMSFLDVGLVPEEFREEFQAELAKLRDAAPKVSFKDMKKVLEEEYGETLDDVFESFDPVADRGRLDRPGLPRALRGQGRRGQGPVPGRRPRRPVRPAEPRDHPAADEVRRARPGPAGARRRDPRAHRGGARLRAGGPEPAHARADLQGPPVRRDPRRVHVAQPRARDRLRVRHRSEVRRVQDLPGAPSATASARSSSASTSARCTATTSSPATRTPATACCWTTAGWRSWTSGCSSASPTRSPSTSCRPSGSGSRAAARS